MTLSSKVAVGVDSVDRAVTRGRRVADRVAALPVHERARLLRQLADLVDARRDRLARLVTEQTGKVVRDARREAERAAWTLRLSADAADQLHGQQIPGDHLPNGVGAVAVTFRDPVGVVAAITPFNAPLNLMAHKVGPAFVAGNAVVVKPSPRCAHVAHELASLALEVGMPDGAITVIEGGAAAALALARHPDVAVVSFTGGPAAGEAVRVAAAFKRVVLELGGNSANIVHADADLTVAIPAIVRGGFANQGQSCISVQRLFIHADIADEAHCELVAHIGALRLGDPLDPRTDVGPVIDDDAATRIVALIDDAVGLGARVLHGGTRHGRYIEPTLLADLAPDARLRREEAFGPVIATIVYNDLDEAIYAANDGISALQASVFTRSLGVAFRAARRLKASGVVVNESSNFRLDHVPYGGTGFSGQGREGPANAVRAFTEERSVVLAGGLGGHSPLGQRSAYC